MTRKRMTVRKIIQQYLKMELANGDPLIRNSDMVKVMNFGRKNYGIYHSVGTYERELRRMKASMEAFNEIGVIDLQDVSSKFVSNEKVLIMRRDPDLF